MNEPAEKIAEVLSKTTYSALPDAVISYTKISILDTLGVALAGFRYEGTSSMVKLAKSWGGVSESTIFVDGTRVPAPTAALVNGAMARAPDFDDVHEEAACHPSVNTIIPSMALAEKIGGISGKDFILATALGVDLIARLGRSLNKKCDVTGHHNLFRIFGAAAGPGRLLKLNKEQMWNLLGIAYASATGIELQGMEDGALDLRIQSGLIAEAGVRAALLAKLGYRGAKNIFYGKYGYYTVYEPEHDIGQLLSGLGETFEGPNCRIKAYPCCSANHKAITAIIDLVCEHDIKPSEIKEINLGLNKSDTEFLCLPISRKYNPETPIDAQFSLPFLTAWAAVHKAVSFNAISQEGIHDAEVRAILPKVKAKIDEEIDEEHPNIVGPALVTIRTVDGREFSKKVYYPRGHTANPMTEKELIGKFRNCAEYGKVRIPKVSLDRTIDIILNLENVEDVASIPALISKKKT